MKIVPGPPIKEIAGNAKAEKIKKKADSGFGTIFQETLNAKAAEKTAPVETPKLGGIPPLGMEPIRPVPKHELIQKTGDLIDTLDQYREKLADPNASLKEIHPLVQKMGEQKEQLLPAMKDLKDDDDLKPVLNQAMVTVSLETVKFNNGFYVD